MDRTTQLFDEIQRLTRYQGRVLLGTMYHPGYAPDQTERPLTVFHRPDPDDSDDEVDTPYYVEVVSYDVEALGTTLEDALEQAVIALREALVSDDEEIERVRDEHARRRRQATLEAQAEVALERETERRLAMASEEAL